MEINSDKSKILLNSIKRRPSTNIWKNGKTVEEVDQFKYLGSTQTKDRTSIKDEKIRLVQAYSAMTRLAILWENKAISCLTKIKLYKSVIVIVAAHHRWYNSMGIHHSSGICQEYNNDARASRELVIAKIPLNRNWHAIAA